MYILQLNFSLQLTVIHHTARASASTGVMSLAMKPEKRDNFVQNAKLEPRRSYPAAETASMAAFRRVAALAVKINLRSTANSEFFGGEKARRCVAAGLCVAAGGAAALYLYNGRERRRQSISGFLRSFPVVEAKEKVGSIMKCFFIIITII